MPSRTLWDAGVESQGTVLTTQLDALADAAWSALGSEYDNSASTELLQYFVFRLAVDTAAAPATGGFVSIYGVTALDGTNYETLDSDNDPRAGKLVATIEVIDTTAAQIRDSHIFTLIPAKYKFNLKNAMGTAFPASGSTVTLYSMSDEGQ